MSPICSSSGGRLTPCLQVEAVGYGMPGARWAGAHRFRQARQSEDWQREMAALRENWAPSAAAAGSGPAAAAAGGSPEMDAAESSSSAATGAGSSVEFEWELHQEALRAWEDAQRQARTDRERAFQAATRRWEAQQAGSGAAREGASRDAARLPHLPGRAVKDPAGLYGALGLVPGADPPAGELKRAFRAAAKAKHPDRACSRARGGSSEPSPASRAAAEDEMRHVIEAYRVLGDPDRRRAYDLTGRVPAQ